MNLVDALQPMVIDRQLVNALAARLGDLLADERLDRRARNLREPTNDEEHDFARTAVHAELLRLAAVRRSEGKSVLTVFDEAAISSAAIAQVLGLGRLQPLLEDDEISDVHVRGNCRVWVKLRNGHRETRDPIVDTDEDLIELVRRAATRLSRQERRFDAGTPELNMQLPDGSRLFATMEVSLRPSLIIRRHRFDISSLEELRLRGLLTEELQEFLTAAVRARRNFVIAGGTGSGKTTLLRHLFIVLREMAISASTSLRLIHAFAEGVTVFVVLLIPNTVTADKIVAYACTRLATIFIVCAAGVQKVKL